MKVYITYDRYRGGKWFYIHQITTKFSEVKKNYKKTLMDFISCALDNYHSFQIQIVNITTDEYEKLKQSVNDCIESNDVYDIMVKIYNQCLWGEYEDTNSQVYTDCLLCTDGCSDNVDLVDFWIKYKNLNSNDRATIMNAIYQDDNLYQKVLKKYINKTFTI